jgi:ADYC domain
MVMFAKLFLVLSCVIAGCADPDLADPEKVVETGGSGGGSNLYDLEPQGHWLLGSQLDLPPFVGTSVNFNTDRATKNGAAVTLDVVNDAALHSGVHVGIDSWFNGVIVSNGTIDLQLTVVGGDSNVAHYQLKRRSGGSAFDTEVCGDAIPLAGVFQIDGLHVAMAGRITFSCDDGVAAKCTRWGYPAGPTPGLRWNAHQACTRMARADYCANGRSHTRMETTIMIGDSIPGVNDLPGSTLFGDTSVWPPDPNNYYFEAAWWPGSHKAGCLSKLRWESLPIGGLCAADLPDPRSDPNAKNCEDLDIGDLVTAGALTFVATSFNDLALQRWHAQTPAGLDYVTTVRGYNADLDDRILRPFQDSHFYVYDGIDGFLLRKVPGSITNPADLTEVYLFRERASSRFVLAAWNEPRFPSATYERFPEREGYVFSRQLPGSVPFWLFLNSATGDYLSAVGDVLPDGYTPVKRIGWIMPREPATP